MRSNRNRRRRAAFTLIELMVVVLIIGLLAGLVGVKVLDRLSDAKITKAQAQIAIFHEAVQHYRLDTGDYPDPSIGLDALVMEPAGVSGWRAGGYLDGSEVPKDPWGNYYLYDCPGERHDFDIYSYGKDNRQGGEGEDGDIYNTQLSEDVGAEDALY